MTVSVTKAVLAVVSAAAGENGDGCCANVVPTRWIAVVVATGIYSLNDRLGIRTIIWLDGRRWRGCKDGGRECEGVEIGTLG